MGKKRLNEVRRHGWLQDYHMNLDQGDDRTVRDARQSTPSKSVSTPPVNNITININLGDILDKIAKGKKSTKEALDEMIENRPNKERLED